MQAIQAPRNSRVTPGGRSAIGAKACEKAGIVVSSERAGSSRRRSMAGSCRRIDRGASPGVRQSINLKELWQQPYPRLVATSPDDPRSSQHGVDVPMHPTPRQPLSRTQPSGKIYCDRTPDFQHRVIISLRHPSRPTNLYNVLTLIRYAPQF